MARAGNRNAPETFELTAVEFNLLLLENLVLGAFLFAAIAWALRRFFDAPAALGVGAGILAVGWALYPAVSVYSRAIGKPMRFLRFAVVSILGAAVGGGLFALLR